VNDTAYWVGFNMVPGIGPARMASLLEAFGTAEAAWNGSEQLLTDAGLDRRSLENLRRARSEIDLEQEWRRIVKAGIRVLTWEHADYPANLQSLDTRPPLLYVRGDIYDDDIWAVAIVGTRRASVYGREVAAQVAGEFRGLA